MSVVKFVEERKTLQSVFLELHPNAPRDAAGLLTVCPNYLDPGVRCVDNDTERKIKSCDDCCRAFWMQEVEL
jgi:hypothetical protein|nr:MAG TPA: hypothetical protein [Caudoviricetes sp.]